MNIKKILSSALVVLTLFASVACFIPVKVDAAYAIAGASEALLDSDRAIQLVRDGYSDYGLTGADKITNADERLAYEMALEKELGVKCIVSVTSEDGRYSIYVNKYTGMMYYKNNLTGEMLTSNPAVLGGYSDTAQRKLMSQINIKYSLDTGEEPKNNGILQSSRDSAERAQITVGYIAGGIRVNYVIGDSTTRYNVPAQIMEEDFIETILEPMLENYENLIREYIVEAEGINVTIDQGYVFNENETWRHKYSEDRIDEYGNLRFEALTAYLDYMTSITDKAYPPLTNSNTPERIQLRAANTALATLATSFVLVEPANEAAYGEGGYAVKVKEGIKFYTENPDSEQAIYVCSKTVADGYTAALENLQNNLAIYAGYNVNSLLEHEKKCLYEAGIIENPVFRCSLEYTFNEDGSLSVRLPVNSISFNEELYNLDSITPLPYLGAGNLTGEGYVFIPDGSGSIIDYSDFYTEADVQNVALKLSVYGDDFAYTTPTAKHKEQVTMPVYGVTTQDTEEDILGKGDTSPAKGFFAILEEGASLASISVEFGGTETKRAAVYSSYAPYPSDQYVRNSSVGDSASTYTIVSDSKYTGSYVTRYVLLGDSSAYPATYVGMATYYRDYLKARGELTALEGLTSDLPLYIEALGSMSVVEKILTFPVNVSKALTTFEDVVTMYKELADVKTKFRAKADEYRAKADASSENKTLRDKYLARAAEYDKLYSEMESISNINFKLTGFANGGMYYTYPSKVKWERALGGKRGFRDLIKTAEGLSEGSANFGVYPEFDFSYVTNTAWGDGISKGEDLARMVDNRYASKQDYNSVLGIYESFYAMVVSTDSLDGLYSDFSKSYSKYGHKALSVANLGSDLNSNLDRDNGINRHESSENVIALLDRIANKDGYDLMISKGNSYAIGYADHILDISTDSSHFIYSSYTVPFTGMVLHSYVSYAGSPVNYAGSPDYEILRSIENGAALYYILCYDNTEYMKEDIILNDYYGIDYQNWYDDLVQQYNVINDAIGAYQGYQIVDHRIILAERVIDPKEEAANLELLKAEYIELLIEQIKDEVDETFDRMKDEGRDFGLGIKLNVDVNKLVADAEDKFLLAEGTLATDAKFVANLTAAVSEYTAKYNSADPGAGVISIESVDDEHYNSRYDFVTDSYGDLDDYDYTDYTADNDRVAVVTYENAATGHRVSFILNYNVYTVEVRHSELGSFIGEDAIPKYGFKKIEG